MLNKDQKLILSYVARQRTPTQMRTIGENDEIALVEVNRYLEIAKRELTPIKEMYDKQEAEVNQALANIALQRIELAALEEAVNNLTSQEEAND